MQKGSGPNQLLRNARLQHHWTQQYVANELQVSTDAYRSWERGRRSPSSGQQEKLCRLFALGPAELGLRWQEQVPLEGVSQPGEETANLPFEQANRRRILARVRSLWIDGVLKESLHHRRLIALGLHEAPDALANPWLAAVQPSACSTRPLPAGTSLVQMYDLADGELLVLGEPGAGKTTLLLELARVLLLRAEQNPLFPLPVLFHLSSWSASKPDLATWLANEFEQHYWVPTWLARAWLQSEHLVLLLDGLDEAGDEEACVQALNTYRREYVRVPLVVCSRQAEYLASSVRLELQRAVSIQPLTKEQVEMHLTCAGDQFAGLRQMFAEDAELQEMVETPLLLTSMTLAYEEHATDMASLFTLSRTREERRDVLLAACIERMLTRRGVAEDQQQQTIRHLSWFAQQMHTHGQTIFSLEHLQPDWLPDQQTTRRYRLTTLRILLGIMALLKAALLASFLGGWPLDQPGRFFWAGGEQGKRMLEWMALGLTHWLLRTTSLVFLCALVLLFLPVLGDLKPLPPVTGKAMRQSLLRGIWAGILPALLGGLGVGLLCWLVGEEGLLHGIEAGLLLGTLFGLPPFLRTLLQSGMRPSPDTQKRVPRLSWRERVLNSLVGGCCAFLGFTGVGVWQSQGIGLLLLLSGLLVGGLFGLLAGFGSGAQQLHEQSLTITLVPTVVWSWAEVWRHLGNTLKAGVQVSLTLLVTVMLVVTTISSLAYGLAVGVFSGFLCGLLAGLVTGLMGILRGILATGWSRPLRDDQRILATPRRKVGQTLRHALLTAGVGGPVAGLTGGLASRLVLWLAGLRQWDVLSRALAVVLTLTFALEIVAVYGGVEVVKHAVLRWYLWRKKLLPWNVSTFLDRASERLVLRKLSGGYSFIHHFLLTYFAKQEPRKDTVEEVDFSHEALR